MAHDVFGEDGSPGPTGPTGAVGPTGAAGAPSFIVVGESDDFVAEGSHFYYVDASGGSVNVTLPVPDNGVQVIVKRIDGAEADVVVLPNGAESIDTGPSSILSAQYEAHTYIGDGSNWWII